MLTMRAIRDRREEVARNLRDRNVELDLQDLLSRDRQARELQAELETVRQRRNEIAKNMKNLADQKQRAPLVEEGRTLKDKESQLEARQAELEPDFKALLAQVPNFTHPDSPIGKDDSQNKVLRSHGALPEFDFEPKDHVDLMERLDLVDFEGGARVAGNKFYFLKNEAVLLELSLMQFGSRLLQEEGFTLFITPDLARREILDGIGFSPRGESTQFYNVENTDLSLVATAEITLGGLLSGQTLEAENLPLLYAGVSHCFRTEAGAAGRESRGL
ncbi:MAG: serine--tRNA ligase, partial [bacterium]